MGLKYSGGFDFADLGVSLKNAAARASKGAAGEMRKQANRVKDLSVRMAPVDKHNLEKAHEVYEQRGDNNRIEFSVEVGGTVGGRNVDDYALEVHENYQGRGYGMGEESLKKQAKNPDVIVGEKFLERAYTMLENEIDETLADIVFTELY